MITKREKSDIGRIVAMVSEKLVEAETKVKRGRSTEPAYECGRADEARAILNALKEMEK